MKQYLTISEFARLRGVNLNSLHYYEKLGLLRPAYIDPRTRYRYYRPEQLSQLDTILLCIDLGIPLKELSSYVDGSGEMQSRRLLEDGRLLAQKKIAALQDGLKKIEHSLLCLDETRQYEGQQGLYTRRIGPRRLYTAAYTQALTDPVRLEKTFSRLYADAQAQGLSPLLPAGVLADRTDDGAQFRLFCEVLGEADCPALEEVPEGDFLCLQLDLQADTDIAAVLRENYPEGPEGPVLVCNMLLNKFRFGSRRTEIQKPLRPGRGG